jgi:hypothetical protein
MKENNESPTMAKKHRGSVVFASSELLDMSPPQVLDLNQGVAMCERKG